MELAYQAYGRSGEALIILHGLFGSRENWHSIAGRLGESFRVFAVDQRNHGESPHSPSMNYRSMAEDVYEFVIGHNLGRAHILGHSMGAKTGMQLALLHPAEVRSLISADMAPRAYSPSHDKILEGLMSLDLDSFQTRKEMEDALQPWVTEVATRQFLLKNVRRTASGRFQWRIGLDEIFKNYPELSQAVESDRRYPGPALFIRGEQSEFLVEGDMENIRRLFPKAQLAAVPGAAHLLHVENPQGFLAIVLQFLRGET